MYETIKSKAVSIKNHVKRNKVEYVFSAVIILLIIGHERNMKHFSAFLEEKGIDPMEFICPEYFEELQALN